MMTGDKNTGRKCDFSYYRRSITGNGWLHVHSCYAGEHQMKDWLKLVYGSRFRIDYFVGNQCKDHPDIKAVNAFTGETRYFVLVDREIRK